MSWDSFKIEPQRSHSLGYRCAELVDLEAIVALHVSNFDESEFSMQLSLSAVRKFYRLCLERADVSVLVGVDTEESIFCFSLAFARYQDFLSVYKKIAFSDIVFSVLCAAFKLQCTRFLAIITYLFECGVKFPPVSVRDYHMGSIVLDSGVSVNQEAVILFYKMFECNVALLKGVSGGVCWTSVFEKNKKSARIVKAALKPDRSFVMRYKLEPTICFVCEVN